MKYIRVLPENIFPLFRTELSLDNYALLSKLKFDKSTLPKNINLPNTYKNKPAVISTNNNITFPEIAVVEIFKEAGWDAYWLDNFHRKVWRTFSKKESELNLPNYLLKLFDNIKEKLDSRGGRWDIVAINEDITLFLECKGIPSNDKIRLYQIRWMKEAIKLGIPKENFIIIEWDYR